MKRRKSSQTVLGAGSQCYGLEIEGGLVGLLFQLIENVSLYLFVCTIVPKGDEDFRTAHTCLHLIMVPCNYVLLVRL